MNREQLRALVGAAVEAGLEALADGLADLTPAGPVRMVPPGELVVDARRFQFRCDHGSDGTTGRLTARQWQQHLAGSLLCWVDPADGYTYLVDGHHRLALALRCAVPAVAVLLLTAADAREARLQGAAANIAQGQADAAEIARWLAAGGAGDGELEALGLSRRSRLLVAARKLEALCPSLLSLVCRGEISEAMGLALAMAPEAAVQRDLWKQAQRRRWSPDQAAEAARLGRLATVKKADTTGCLPGLEALMPDSSDLDAVLGVRAAIRKALGQELTALATVARRRSAASLEGRNVAVIDTTAASSERDAARAQARLFDLLAAGHSGPLQTCIRELAALVTPGRSAAQVVNDHLQAVRRAIEAELG